METILKSQLWKKDRWSLKQKKDIVQIISNVFYVLDSKINLLSLGQLQEKGYEIFIENGVCQIQDDNLGLIAPCKMIANRIFHLYFNNI